MKHDRGSGRRKQNSVTLDVDTQNRVMFISDEIAISQAEVIRTLVDRGLAAFEAEIWGK